MTPEVQLVEDYNNWLNDFLAAGTVADAAKLETELSPFITNETVLKEPSNVPWGGLMVGYEGWAWFFRKSAPIFRHFAGRHEATDAIYYQNGNVVLRENSITIKGTTADEPVALVMTLVEKYTIENGKIVYLDEFWDDPALFVELVAKEGVALN